MSGEEPGGRIDALTEEQAEGGQDGGWSPRAWGRPKDTGTGVSPLCTTQGGEG